ncbi:CALMODULIN-BINDING TRANSCRIPTION ACTIVATOR 6 [Salix purpurea]|uniref:CALMODULIN-BINDING TRANSCRIPTION ACTIVATOR 6 n=1 Tax=Salix purpurea TaxID=77065 RepID=A0A9Q0UAK1_SALPP|nr:CALMODULIN-BINDING TRANSCRIPTION ACTIVATOR 6 [Salix purpurea]
MESRFLDGLVGSEIHGFHTLRDLDVPSIMEESRTRWLRPNEIHAMLCNHKYFTINVKPVNLPIGGTIILFDRKMLRNFRKDAHEHLKVGDEERIHVYYAHGQDNPTFVRRCYWLLDKTLEHIVLVHYRETREGSPATPVNSHSSSVSDQSGPWLLSEESDSGAAHAYYAGKKDLGSSDSSTVINHEIRLHELNTLEWDELLTNDPSNSILPGEDKIPSFDQQNQIAVNGPVNDRGTLLGYQLSAEMSALGNLTESVVRSDNTQFSGLDNVHRQLTGSRVYSDAQRKNSVVLSADDSPGSVDDAVLESSISSSHDSFASPGMDQHQSSVQEQMFTITDFSPAWGFSNQTTKILVTGYFHEQYLHLAKSKLFCICGDAFVLAEVVQAGVYSCMVLPHSPGLVNLCLSLDGSKPISQILSFEYLAPPVHDSVVLSEEKSRWEEFHIQMRLTYLLSSTSKTLNALSSKVSPAKLKEAKKFANKTSNISNTWAHLIKSIEGSRISVAQAKDGLFELSLRNAIKEWLLERILEGCKTTEYDTQGLGVIHLCAIMGYTWSAYLFSWSGLSLDFRDKHGWTAIHWAAYYGREKMVAALLSAGAKPNLVTDPTKENPSGCTAADLASAKGYDGLAAYLSEKALVAQFESMIIAGNATGSLQMTATDTLNSENLSEEELHLKDALAAYRTAAGAAARIQVAFREHSLKVHTKAVQSSSPEDEARNIIAAMKIQHAFRNYESKKKMAAAAHIQHRFRTWKTRREFLNMRRHAIRIQAVFRGFQARKQYRKRKGFRGLQVEPVETYGDPKHESDTEEDFYKISQKQAEERVERSVIRVQAMFRSKQAQEQYRRMKLTHNQAMVEYEGLLDTDMV